MVAWKCLCDTYWCLYLHLYILSQVGLLNGQGSKLSLMITFKINNMEPTPGAVIGCGDTKHVKVIGAYGWTNTSSSFDVETSDGSLLQDVCYCKQICEIPSMKATNNKIWTLYVKYQCKTDDCKTFTKPALQVNTLGSKDIYRTECDLRAVLGNNTVFQQYVLGRGYLVMPCAPGTSFNQSQCRCSDFAPTGQKKKAAVVSVATGGVKVFIIVLPIVGVTTLVLLGLFLIMYIRSRRCSSNMYLRPIATRETVTADHIYDEIAEPRQMELISDITEETWREKPERTKPKTGWKARYIPISVLSQAEKCEKGNIK